MGTPLSCRDHPFFLALPEIFEELMSFYDSIFSIKKMIFLRAACLIGFHKRVTLEEIFRQYKILRLIILNIPTQTVSDVAATLDAIRKMA